jgi:aminoglycoside phosphotransferase family enzyme/predicted kinase
MSSHSANNPPATPPLIAGLLRPEAYPHPVGEHPSDAPRLIETHISWVILAGKFAYKIKKPLTLGFLDFSSLEKRRHFCAEEIRLNARMAPETYLATVAITGSPENPRMEGTGPAIEWAVKMRAFPADATLDREAEISAEQIDAIAESIAAFHAVIATAPGESDFGAPDSIFKPVRENFDQLRKLLPAQSDALPLLESLRTWSESEGERLRPHFAARKANGFVRECHGDLHLGNIAWVENKPLVFDALEFNPALRHIDVISEIAFLSMDLRHRGRRDLAWRLLDRYLEQTGDIHGITALPYYQVYRAMVRAKVAAILAAEHPEHADFGECLSYLRLADRLAHGRCPALVLMHGVSGSGKTWLSQHLLEQLGALRLRSDVTRKRLFGLKPLQDSAAIPGGIYTSAASARTLATLIEDARTLLAAGFLVIVDATFIHQAWRAPFQALAEELGVDWRIVSLEAPSDVLQARVSQRQQSGADASEAGLAVLASQLAHLEPFSAREEARVLRFASGWTAADAVARLAAALDITPES